MSFRKRLWNLGKGERTHGGANAECGLEAVLGSLVVAVAVEEDAESDLDVRVDRGELGALALDASVGSSPCGAEEEVNDAVRGVPWSSRSGRWWDRDGRVGEREPPLKRRKCSQLLPLVHVRNREGLCIFFL